MTKKDATKEMNYRLACWIFINLSHKGVLSDAELKLIKRKLLVEFDPPMRCLEVEVKNA